MVVAIITPVYRPNLDLFKQCVASVRNQTDTRYRWYVGFDGSESFDKVETSACFLELLLAPNRELSIFDEHRGQAETRNSLLDRVAEPYVMFLDCDNLIAKDTVEKLQNFLVEIEVEGPHMVVWSQERIFDEKRAIACPEPIPDLLRGLKANVPDLGQYCHSRGAIRFDPGVKRFDDWDYFLRLIRAGTEQLMLDAVLSTYDGRSRPERVQARYDYVEEVEDMLHRWEDRVDEETFEKLLEYWARAFGQYWKRWRKESAKFEVVRTGGEWEFRRT